MSSRCTGACCTSFFLRDSPQELQAEYLRISLIPPSRRTRRDDDTYTVYPLLVLTKDHRSPEQLDEDRRHRVRPLWARGHAFEYSCKQFDPVQKICKIYETRPYMCRSYPNGKLCEKPDCTWHPDDQMREWPEDQRPLRLFDDPEAFLRALLAQVRRRGRRYYEPQPTSDFTERGIKAFHRYKEREARGLRRGRRAGPAERISERVSGGLGGVSEAEEVSEWTDPTDDARGLGGSGEAFSQLVRGRDCGEVDGQDEDRSATEAIVHDPS